MADSDIRPPAWADLPAYRDAFRDRCPVALVAPEALQDRAQWIVWRYEPHKKHPDHKPLKVPYYIDGKKRFGTQGDDKDRARLAPFLKARAFALANGFDGLGFAFLPGDGLVGIDLDGMIDPDTGEVNPTMQGILDACNSYTETSPSGSGVHVTCTLPEDVAQALEADGKRTTFKSNAVGVEVFSGRQYFTFTGQQYGNAATVEAITLPTMRRLWATVRGPAKPPEPAPAAAARPAQQHSVGGRQRSVAETVALAEEALGVLSPDEYNGWIKIGLALHELGAAGFMVWDAWSARSAKYDADDCRKRWAGFAPAQITLGTLFGRAQDAGWVPPWEKAKARKGRAGKASVKESLTPEPPTDAAPPPDGPSPPMQAPAGGGDGPPDDPWQDDLLVRKGEVSPCLANAELILSCAPEWRGVVAYDEFAEAAVHRRRMPKDHHGPESGPWLDMSDSRAAIALQRAWKVEFSPSTVGQAVEVVARQNRFHPVRDALEALPPWDEVRRTPFWLSDFLGVEQTPYVALVAQFFLRGMIKRVMEPGCKFDYCLVLEGEQGRGKSSVARILSWQWFCDTDLDLSNKDSLMALPGHWVYEIAELGGLMKAEERRQKSFLSRQEDEYRPPYGKRLIKVPRQCVFIGTTNEDEYLKDPTGGRRFWPALCGDAFNLDGLRSCIELLFAEALHDYRAGERCWPTPDEQAQLFTPEQVKRGMPEPFEDILYAWVANQVKPFSMAEAAMDGLNLSADKLTPAVVTRLGIVLKRLDCVRIEDRNAVDPGRRRLYLSPEAQKARGMAPITPIANNVPAKKGGGHAPF